MMTKLSSLCIVDFMTTRVGTTDDKFGIISTLYFYLQKFTLHNSVQQGTAKLSIAYERMYILHVRIMQQFWYKCGLYNKLLLAHMDMSSSNIRNSHLKFSWLIVFALPQKWWPNELDVVSCTHGAMVIHFTMPEIIWWDSCRSQEIVERAIQAWLKSRYSCDCNGKRYISY